MRFCPSQPDPIPAPPLSPKIPSFGFVWGQKHLLISYPARQQLTNLKLQPFQSASAHCARLHKEGKGLDSCQFLREHSTRLDVIFHSRNMQSHYGHGPEMNLK